MTKTNLVGIIVAVAVLFTMNPMSANAKSANEIAKTGIVVAPVKVTTVAVENLIVKVPVTKPAVVKAIVPNKWQDSGYVAVWRGVPRWIRDLGYCIRRHESINSGHYHAHNGTSSAAGAYQILTGTWQGNAKFTKVNGKHVARKYAYAHHAPSWVQDAVFIHSVRHGGIHNWVGTHCGYGT